MIRLEARKLSVQRGEDLLIDDLTFAVESGEALVVTGRNGSGKSTLIQTVAGLIHPESGDITLHVPNQPRQRVAEACHYLGHRNAMKREMTVFENLAFWKAFMGDHAGGAGIDPDAAADRLGLGTITHLPFGYLSAGQQRRMAMAKLLVAFRPVWLLDEPTAALDVQSEKLFADLVNAHLAQGGLVMVATHQPLDIAKTRQLVMAGFSFHQGVAA